MSFKTLSTEVEGSNNEFVRFITGIYAIQLYFTPYMASKSCQTLYPQSIAQYGDSSLQRSCIYKVYIIEGWLRYYTHIHGNIYSIITDVMVCLHLSFFGQTITKILGKHFSIVWHSDFETWWQADAINKLKQFCKQQKLRILGYHVNDPFFLHISCLWRNLDARMLQTKAKMS